MAGYVYSIGADEALAGSHSIAFSDAFDVNHTLYWIGGAVGDTTNWNNALNWAQASGAGGRVPTSGDIAYFNSLGNGYNCDLNVDANCSSVIADATWTKNFIMGASSSITVTEDILFDHTGTLTLRNTLTLSGEGTLHIGSGVGTLTLTSCDLDLKGDTRLDIDKALSASLAFRNITCAYSGKTTMLIGSQFLYYNGVMTLQNGGTLNNNIAYPTYKYVVWCGSGTVTPFVQNGATLTTDYAAGTFLGLSIAPSGAATVSISIQSTTWHLYLGEKSGTTVTYNMDGAISVYVFCITVNNASATGQVIFNTNNYNITTLGDRASYASFSIAQALVAFVANSVTCNFGSSVVTVGGSLGFFAVRGVSAYTELNMGSSQWTVAGSFNISTVDVFNAGTSTINITSTGTIDSTNKTFNILSLGTLNVAKTITWAGGSNTIGRLFIKAKTTVAFKEGNVYTISSYTAGDWDGTAGNLVTIKSITDGQQHTLANPTGMSVSYVNVRDSIATNDIIAYDGTNVNSGNNIKWKFIRGSSWYYLSNRRGR